MKQQVANYTVLIEKDKRTGTSKPCYTAYVPILGIAADGDSLEEVQKEIQSLISFHLESLAEEGEEIPTETKNSFITKLEAILPKNAQLAHS